MLPVNPFISEEYVMLNNNTYHSIKQTFIHQNEHQQKHNRQLNTRHWAAMSFILTKNIPKFNEPMHRNILSNYNNVQE